MEKYSLYSPVNENYKEEKKLLADIFGVGEDETYKLELTNIIISDVRIDQNETTFNDVAARVLNFNKKQEVQRVHDPETNKEKNTDYGAVKSKLELYDENDSQENEADKKVRKALEGNPFADCIWHELDQRIIYRKVRIFLE
jgi:hypothetical protein